MSKKFLTLGILIVVFTGIFIPVVKVSAQSWVAPVTPPTTTPTPTAEPCTDPTTNQPGTRFPGGPCVATSITDQVDVVGMNAEINQAEANKDGMSPASWIFRIFAEGISRFLMMISSLVLGFAGKIFDWIVDITIINMSQNMSGGLGVGINNAWATLRDIANICFIFVLLYAAFKAMFDLSPGSIGKTVMHIIIVALLINFSLFFSKVVIDASNIVSVGFYDSIAVNSSSAQNQNSSFSFSGISGGYMNMLGLQSIFSADILNVPDLDDPVKLLLVGVMSSIVMLIAAVILLISGIMFITRFIILIFIMILSPLALIAYIIPKMKSHFDEWVDALISQSFFAPIFFAMTWVVFRLGSSLKAMLMRTGQSSDLTTTFSNPGGAVGILVNYILIIGFAIAALIISKKMASKTAGFTQISGGITSGAAWAGRNTIGRGSRAVFNSSKLRDAATDENRSWATRTLAKSALWTSQKGAKGSFDIRGIGNTGVGKALGAGEIFKGMGSAGGKGGLTKIIDEKVKKKAAYSKDVYGDVPGDKKRDDIAKENLEKQINNEKNADEGRIKSERNSAVQTAKDEHKTKSNDVKEYEKSKGITFDTLEQLKKDKKAKEFELQAARKSNWNEETIEKIQKESDSLSKSIEFENTSINEAKKKLEDEDPDYVVIKNSANEAKKTLAEAQRNQKAKIKDSDYSKEIQDKIKEHKEFTKSGNRRQQAYAKKVGSGIFGWTAVNKASQKKIEEQAKEKSADQKLAEAAKKAAKEELEKEEKEKKEETGESENKGDKSSNEGEKKDK